MKKIEKTITRDLQLVDIEAWYAGYMTGLNNWLGWSYSDSIFHVHNGHVDLYRRPEEHQLDFRNKVLEKMAGDTEWFINEGEKSSKLVKEIYNFFDQAEKGITEADNEKIYTLYEKYFDYIQNIMGPFIMAYWLPNWFDKEPIYSEKFAREIDLAMEQRKEMEQIFPKGALLINSIMTRVSKLLALEGGLEWFITKEELKDFLFNNKKPETSILLERKAGFIFSKDGINFAQNTQDDLKRVLNSLNYDFDIIETTNTTELTGQTACRGVAQGPVRIIMSKKDISTLVSGEVLVTAMTTPEYLPAMQKSIAFITDEGGITCHAAIVARELNKPCIIGTKIATQVLKDGDIVEVDADNGIVKIIK